MADDLKTHIANFRHWLKTDTDKAPRWEEERRERLAWYHTHLGKDHISKITQGEFAFLIKSLWASNIFKNKDYKVGRLIQDNGLDKLRASLEELLYGEDSIEKRWDSFRSSIKGLGPSSLSEILTFHNPQEHALVNLKPYKVLPRLGLTIDSVSDGRSYCRAVEDIGRIKKELEGNGVPDVDFILTDFFIAYLFLEVFDLAGKHDGLPPIPTPGIQDRAGKGTTSTAVRDYPIDSHEGAEAVLLALGNLLGYDTYTPDANHSHDGRKLGEIATLQELPAFTSEKIMDSVENIDVVWLKDEWPEYFFEVEHTTGVTSGLLRIYQARKLNTRFFIVGPKDVLKKFEKEVEKAPFNSIKDKYCFRSYEQLRDMFVAASNYRSVKDKFLA
jgi:hypothetical protein